MRVLSLSVGLPREVEWEGHRAHLDLQEPGRTPPAVSTLNFEGDQQSDLTVHGGIDKAVYVYPSEHYEKWHGASGRGPSLGRLRREPDHRGAEEDVRIGDRLRMGSAEFVVLRPRMPCYKLGIRFGRPDMLKRMLRNGRTGFYFAVTA